MTEKYNIFKQKIETFLQLTNECLSIEEIGKKYYYVNRLTHLYCELIREQINKLDLNKETDVILIINNIHTISLIENDKTKYINILIDKIKLNSIENINQIENIKDIELAEFLSEIDYII